MKKIIYILTALLFIQCSSDTKLSQKERDFAINQLNNSKDNLLSATNGLNNEQLNYKVDEASWSIAECTEHATLFVEQVFEILGESLELQANPDRRKDVKFSDEELIVYIKDRAKKGKTEEDLEPKKRYGNHSSTLKAFNEKLERHIKYLKTTKDDLRNHFVNFGAVDTYQMFLYMAAHTERHIQQINEIKNNINFPKN